MFICLGGSHTHALEVTATLFAHVHCGFIFVFLCFGF